MMEHPMTNEMWEPFAIKPMMRKEKQNDAMVDVSYTIVMLRDRNSGNLKTWTAPGDWTLEQIKGGANGERG